MKDFRGKTALVTGAASGIGRATALALAREGCRIIACDVNDDGLAGLDGQLRSSGGLFLQRRVDVSSPGEMENFAREVHGRVPAVDILVNNAGVAVYASFVNTSLEDFRWIMSINLWGVIHGCHFFIPPMVKNGGGHVVNVSSALGYAGAPNVAAYATTKFGVLGLSESLRIELADKNIGVSAICPGIIATGIVGAMRMAGVDNPDSRRARLMKMYQDRKFGPGKVAEAIVKAIRHNQHIVPVTPEAWAFFLLKRLTPQHVPAIARFVNDKVAGG
ncbi:MAG: putative oxidoreductase EphD [Myxococcota bacterium]|nr:putative oxidoreductase EphD [Myxococcota bacterium]